MSQLKTSLSLWYTTISTNLLLLQLKLVHSPTIPPLVTHFSTYATVRSTQHVNHFFSRNELITNEGWRHIFKQKFARLVSVDTDRDQISTRKNYVLSQKNSVIFFSKFKKKSTYKIQIFKPKNRYKNYNWKKIKS